MYIPWNRQQCEISKETCLPSYQRTTVIFATFVLFILGFIACITVYKLRRIRNKAIVLYITGFVYFAFVIMMGYYCSQNTVFNDWLVVPTPNSFIFEIYYSAMPLISVIFMGLPFILTFEIMFFAALAFLVFVPLFNDSGSSMWLQFDDTSVYKYFISVVTSVTLYRADQPLYDIINATVPIEPVQELASTAISICNNPAVEKDYCIIGAR